MPSVTRSHVSIHSDNWPSSHSTMLPDPQKHDIFLVYIWRFELSELLNEWNPWVPCIVLTRYVCEWYTWLFLVDWSPITIVHHLTIASTSWRFIPIKFIYSLRSVVFMHAPTLSCSRFSWLVSKYLHKWDTLYFMWNKDNHWNTHAFLNWPAQPSGLIQ